MRARLVISIAIGAAVSALILLLTATFPNAPWPYFGAPGYIAIMLVWGPHSGFGIPEVLVPVIAFAINTMVYGLIAFGILGRFKAFT